MHTLPQGVQFGTSPFAQVPGYCGAASEHVQTDHHGAKGHSVQSGARMGPVSHHRVRPRGRVRAAARGTCSARHDRAGPHPTDIRRVGGSVAYAGYVNANSATATGSPCVESPVSRPRGVSEVRPSHRPSHWAIGVVPGSVLAVRRLPSHVGCTGLTAAFRRIAACCHLRAILGDEGGYRSARSPSTTRT